MILAQTPYDEVARLYHDLERQLAGCRGVELALTLDALAERVSADRRSVEQVIEHNLSRFPFVLVSGAKGYWIPTAADEINRYLHSLHTRHRRMQIREETVRMKASAHGWPLENGVFVNRPVQQELFA